MRIILVRHGQTTANAENRFQGQLDFSLSPRGQRQASKLAPCLAAFQPGLIFTSDLTRSIETARPTVDLLGLDPVISTVFREFSWGILEGLSWRDIEQQYPGLYKKLRRDLRYTEIPGQEPFTDFHRRLQQGLAILTDSTNPPTVALIGHGRYLNTLVVEFLGLDFNGPWPFIFSSGAVTALEERDGRRMLLAFNDKCHLCEPDD